jgi:DNA-binding NarL/FixJ family response regulator
MTQKLSRKAAAGSAKRVAPPRRSQPASAAHPGPEAHGRPGEAARILVVEDDFLIALQVEAALAEAGFRVVGVAASAEEATELAAAHRPDLVVMDIRLSGKRDGIDLAIELHRDHAIRCLLATAHADAQARRRAEPAGPLGWLQKPYTMASLVGMVREALDLS